ncbi:MAG TPA: response regulator transcription factor [Bryobacterales bacterium]|nr:response regulator transcription factor [Bryobacterales bacterium]
MPKILLVDDDTELCGLLDQYLRGQGFEVQAAHTGPAGLEAALAPGIDLVVLDVMLPGLDGLEVLRRLRAQSHVPVLMLTARGEEVDRIVGLEIGADDYLPKPFNPRELVARIRAILRRGEVAATPRPRLRIHGVELDPGARTVTRDGVPVELTTLEFDILEQLMRSAGRVLSRDQIMDALYERPATPFDRSIDMHISHLRRKLDAAGSGDRQLIKTIRSVGYVFTREAGE